MSMDEVARYHSAASDSTGFLPQAMCPISRFIRVIPIFVLSLITGCGSWSNPIDRISPHRIDIQQGNAITQDMLDKLKPGMTPSQVRFILGTPLVVDPFHKNRWDYVYRHERGGKMTEQRRITVIFEDERLKSLEGDVTAAGTKPVPAQAQGKQEEEKK
jgi:outer membrane protein assembly factor BamE